MSSFFKRDSSEQLESTRRELLSDEFAALLQSMQRPRFTRDSVLRFFRFLLILSLLATIVFGAHLIWRPEAPAEEAGISSQKYVVETILPDTSSNENSYALEVTEQEKDLLLVGFFVQFMLGLLAICFIAVVCLVIAGRRYTRHRWLA